MKSESVLVGRSVFYLSSSKFKEEVLNIADYCIPEEPTVKQMKDVIFLFLREVSKWTNRPDILEMAEEHFEDR